MSDKYMGTQTFYGNEDAEIEALQYSLSLGQNHLDCAQLYGRFYTDEVVGRAIAGMRRDDLYIADKIWKTDLGTGLVRPVFDEMLRKLGTDYIDLLYIHNSFADAPWREAIPQINDLIDEGVVRAFAVSNFTVEELEETNKLSRYPISAVQQNFNVIYQEEANSEYREYCKENDIALIAYQPLKRKEVLESEEIQRIAKKHDATPAQIALAWLVRVGAYPIPKAIQKEHIKENLASTKINLDEEDMKVLTQDQ